MLKLPKKSQKHICIAQIEIESTTTAWNLTYKGVRGETWTFPSVEETLIGGNGLGCLSLPAFSIWPTLVPAHSWERCCMALPWRPCLHYVSLGMVVEVVEVGEEVRVLTNPDPVNPPATTASVSPSPPAQFPRSKHDKMMKSANQQICSLGPGPKMKTGPTYTLHASKTLRYQNWYL